MSRKSNQPSSRDLKKTFNDSVIDPRSPLGIVKIIMEHDNPYYFETRAKELITEAQNCIGPGTPDQHQLANYHDRMKIAITLLGLARLKRKSHDSK